MKNKTKKFGVYVQSGCPIYCLKHQHLSVKMEKEQMVSSKSTQLDVVLLHRIDVWFILMAEKLLKLI